MAEKYVIVDQMKLTYEGLFDAHELFNFIDAWVFDKGYDRLIRKDEEISTDDGTKTLHWDMRPWKKLTDYAKSCIRIRAYISDMKDVEVKKNGQSVKLQQGKIQFIFDAFLQTDWQFRWNDYPFLFFLNIIFDKHLFSTYTNKYKSTIFADLNHINARIKNFLNTHQYSGEFKPQWG